MPPLLLKLLGIVIVIVALWGLVSSRIIAGSKGLQAHLLILASTDRNVFSNTGILIAKFSDGFQ